MSTNEATILDGKGLAKSLREDLARRVEDLTKALGRAPGLAVILVGEDPASQIYVRNKGRAAEQAGIVSKMIRLPETASQQEVEQAVEALNEDATIDGFLVQLPLPANLDENAVTLRISPDKDADGLHPSSLGRLLAGLPGPRPCTPSGVMALLDKAGIEFQGKHAVVVGRSTIVGKPQALMLLERHATVSICHSRTVDLEAEVRRADILVVAVGVAHLVKGSWIKKGAAVVDVGMNRIDGKLAGDVDFAAAKVNAGCITPVPGGVGPMTIAMLLANTVDAAARKL